ncbi:hypothetical protein DFJ73DRAFT_781968 [Zopfochytrium polystomum]|nr:hypothetical protein DFJ73DRAFT_781968 [Zopfochytrium polystomum]
MSGKGKTPAKPASGSSTTSSTTVPAASTLPSRPITDFFSPSPFAAVHSADFPPLPPPSTPKTSRPQAKRKSVDHPSPDQLNWAPTSGAEFEALELALFYAAFADSAFLDHIVRIEASPNDLNTPEYIRNQLDSLATAARTTLAPIFLTMERIITDQDQLISDLRSRLTAVEEAVAAAAVAPPPPVRPPAIDAAVNTDPLSEPIAPTKAGNGQPARAKGKGYRAGSEGSRKGDRTAQPKYPSRQAKQAVELSLAPSDTIPALVFRPLTRPAAREPVRYVPVYFRALISHPEARKNPLHWLRASLAAMKAPAGPSPAPASL